MNLTIHKKGVSAVVATLAIVLITVAAAAVIAQVVVPFIQSNLKKSSECISYRQYFQFEEKSKEGNVYKAYNCRYLLPGSNPEVNRYGAMIRAVAEEKNLKENIASLTLAFYSADTGKSSSATIIPNTPGGTNAVTMYQGGSSTFLDLPAPGEIRTYVYNNGAEHYNRTEVSLTLKSGRICPVTDTITIEECSGVVLS